MTDERRPLDPDELRRLVEGDQEEAAEREARAAIVSLAVALGTFRTALRACGFEHDESMDLVGTFAQSMFEQVAAQIHLIDED